MNSFDRFTAAQKRVLAAVAADLARLGHGRLAADMNIPDDESDNR